MKEKKVKPERKEEGGEVGTGRGSNDISLYLRKLSLRAGFLCVLNSKYPKMSILFSVFYFS